MKSRLIGKDPDAGKEDELVEWHHRLNGHEFELQEIVKDRGAWHVAVYGVTKSQP